MRKIIFVAALISLISIKLQASLASDIAALFAVLEANTDDSYAQANAIMIPYKKNPQQMKLLLSAVQTVNGVANTTPLHVTAQKDNLAVAALIYQKASVLGAEYQTFSRAMANAKDANGFKPIDYTNDPSFISFLSYFTDP